MKKIIVARVFVFLFFIFSRSNGHSQSCTDWIDYTETGITYSMAIDEAGNVYHAATFDSTIQVGSTQINMPFGYINGFYLVKYDASGQVKWLRYFYSTGLLALFTPQVSSGNDAVWVAGGFIEGLYSENNSTIQTSPGTYSHLILKFDTASGNLINQVFFATTNYISSYSSIFGLYASDEGSIYATGPFRDSLTIGTNNFYSPEGRNVFVARLNSDLDVLWAIRSTTATSQTGYYNRGYSIKTDKDENIIVGGLVDETITFGSTTFTCLGTSGNPYLAKFDQNGNCLWIRGGVGSTVFSNIYAIETDGDGNVYCAGPMDSPLTFDGTTLDPAFGALYFNKYNPSGILQWAKQYGLPVDTDTQVITDLNFDGNQTIWATGWSEGTQFGSVTLPNGGVFATAFNLEGSPNEAFELTGLISSYEARVDADHSLYIEGNIFAESINLFGNVISFGDTISAAFVLKFCDETLGTEEPSGENSWNICPNPSSQFLYIAQEENTDPFPFKVSVFDVFGRGVFLSNYSSFHSPLKLDIQDWPGGVYLIEISSNAEAVYRKKIIVQH